MPDPDVKNGETPYEGPYSDLTKITVLSASLATVGIVGGFAAAAVIPATAASTGAAGGAGAYVAAGTAVGVGTVSTALLSTRPDLHEDDCISASEARLVEIETQEDEEEDPSGTSAE